MRWAMTAKHGRWPEIKTYHPDDPFALWRVPDGQRYLLDRFFTKLLKLQEAMTTATGRAMAERRIAFLRLYLQELQQEITEGRYGYDMPAEVTYRLPRDEKSAERSIYLFSLITISELSQPASLPLARSDAASRAGMPSVPHRSRLCKDKPRTTSP